MMQSSTMTASDVLDALAAHGGQLAEDVKHVITDTLKTNEAIVHTGHEVRYVVRASGHSGGGSPLSLTLSVEAHYVLAPVSDAAAAQDAAAEASQDTGHAVTDVAL